MRQIAKLIIKFKKCFHNILSNCISEILTSTFHNISSPIRKQLKYPYHQRFYNHKGVKTFAWDINDSSTIKPRQLN